MEKIRFKTKNFFPPLPTLVEGNDWTKLMTKYLICSRSIGVNRRNFSFQVVEEEKVFRFILKDKKTRRFLFKMFRKLLMLSLRVCRVFREVILLITDNQGVEINCVARTQLGAKMEANIE